MIRKKAEEELFKIKNVLTHEEQGYSDDSNKNKNENTNLKQKRKIFNDSDDFDKDFDRKKRKTEMKIINPANTFGTISYGGSQERNINKFFFLNMIMIMIIKIMVSTINIKTLMN